MSKSLALNKFEMDCLKELIEMVKLNAVAPRYIEAASAIICGTDMSHMSVRDAVDNALSLARVAEDYRVKAKVNHPTTRSTRR
jgi:hypothetical protein